MLTFITATTNRYLEVKIAINKQPISLPVEKRICSHPRSWVVYPMAYCVHHNQITDQSVCDECVGDMSRVTNTRAVDIGWS